MIIASTTIVPANDND